MDAVLNEVATRLADEGVPVAAIARATRIPTGDLWEQFQEAWRLGELVGLPRNDWPPNVRRGARAPEFAKLADMTEDRLINALTRLFTISRTQARLLLALVERHDVSNADLLEIYCTRDDVYHESGYTNLRIQFASLRKKLKPFGLFIETLWCYGKQMSGPDRRRTLDMLMADLETGDLQKCTKSS